MDHLKDSMTSDFLHMNDMYIFRVMTESLHSVPERFLSALCAEWVKVLRNPISC